MWYTAMLLLEGGHQIEPALPSLWEEVIVLIEAEDEENARLAAESLGRARQREYYASEPRQHLVRWTFKQVERVSALEAFTLKSGTELFSRFLRPDEVESLLRPFEDGEAKGSVRVTESRGEGADVQRSHGRGVSGGAGGTGSD